MCRWQNAALDLFRYCLAIITTVATHIYTLGKMWHRLISIGMKPGIQSTPFIKEIHTCCLRYTIFFRLYIYIYIYTYIHVVYWPTPDMCSSPFWDYHIYIPSLLCKNMVIESYTAATAHETFLIAAHRRCVKLDLLVVTCNAVCGMSCAVCAAFCYALTMHCNPQGTQHTCVAAFHNVTDYEPMTCTYMTFGKRNIHLYQMMNMLVFNLPGKFWQ